MNNSHLVAGYFASRASVARVLALAGVGSLPHRIYAFGEQPQGDPLGVLAAAWLRPGEVLLLIEQPELPARRLLEILRRSGETIHATVLGSALLGSGLESGPANLRTRWNRSVAVVQSTLARQGEQSADAPGMSRMPAKWGIAESAYEDNLAGISLIEHRYIIDGYLERIGTLLKATRGLTHLPKGSVEGVKVPMVYELAREAELALRGRLNEDRLRRWLRARCREINLKRGEFKSVEPMLVVALMEDLAAQVAAELRHEAEVRLARLASLRVGEMPGGDLPAYLAGLAAILPSPPPELAALLLELLRDQPERQAQLARTWSLPTGEPLARLLRRNQRGDAERLERFNRVVTSLRALTRTDWETLIEDISPVVTIMRTDPSGHFPRLDGPTRAWYADRVAEIAKWSRRPERAVAAAVVEKAAAGSGVTAHIGYHLIDDGRRPFERSVRARVPAELFLYLFARRHPAGWLLGLLGVTTTAAYAGFVWLLAATAGGLPEAGVVMLSLLALIPISQLGVELSVYLTARVTRPMSLPKLRFPRAIPEAYQSVVVVPTMLRSLQSVQTDLAGLETRYLANSDRGLSFGLLTDFTDSEAAEQPEDQSLVDCAAQGIRRLQARYPRAHFFLFHRPRTFNPGEGVWMGEERKRGKLEALNNFILGKGEPGYLVEGDGASIQSARFVITLDEDTELPPGAAKRLVETLAHPLNEPHWDEQTRRLTRGFGIVQPRVATSFESGRASRLTGLLGGRLGVDPYMVTYSDLYFDLARDAIFHGKGIYDPRAFDAVLGGRLPPGYILSHDLLEGSYLRVALATDIILFDSFPATNQALLARTHRWVRGDWQIEGWLDRMVPRGRDRLEANPLGDLNRWKIADNLRRSLLPVATTGLVVAGLAVGGRPRMLLLALALVSVYLPVALQLPGFVMAILRLRRPDLPGLGLTAAECTYRLMMAPRLAWLTLDVVARVWYRFRISHRHLLQWQTAASAGALSRRGIDFKSLPIAVLALAGFARVAQDPSAGTTIGLLVLGLWTVSPIVLMWLDRRRPAPVPSAQLTDTDRAMLRRVGLQTWRFFDELMTEPNHFLPPDNLQVTLKLEVAQRTSPTNIGLGILAWLAVRDLGFITPDQLADRTGPALDSLARMEKYRGHIYNWYRVDTLEPLPPRYVSMVDSGNLMASLWAYRQGAQGEQTRPLIEPVVADGWVDMLEEFKARVPRAPGTVMTELITMAQQLRQDSRRPAALATGLAALVAVVKARAAEIRQSAGGQPQAFLADRLTRQAAAWDSALSRYLGWYLQLADPPAPVQQQMSAGHQAALVAYLATMPTLASLVHAPGFPPAGAEPPAVQAWWQEVAQARRDSAAAARATIGRLEGLARAAGVLADETDMRFLYNRRRKVFHIGYNREEAKLDPSYYDLLASEARLGSFTAIAAGQIPAEHWWSLGRNSRLVDGRPVLLSWSGTMFEFLMPGLLMDEQPGTLLARATATAVDIQRRYARALEIPWGISESAHSSLDYDNTYQYQAFGVPAAGIQSGLDRGLVVAPYASLLALAVKPAAVMANLRVLERLGFRGDMGFFEAVDYRRPATASGERGVGAFTYMAHHQAMGLLSITNVLTEGAFPRRFSRDLRVRAARTLLQERPAKPEKSRQDATLRKVKPLKALSVPAVISSTAELTSPLPGTHILTNGKYTVMVTTTGSGFSRWGHIEVGRWSTETLRGERGSYLYLLDPATCETWSTTYEPTLRDDDTYRVTFRPEKAIFERTMHGISTRQEIYVAPDHDVEVRRVRLRNTGSTQRTIEATSFMEFGMVPHADLASHPAFQKLFIGIEPLPEQDGILAHRRPRAEGEEPVWAAHLLVNLSNPASRASLQTDRETFLGRSSSPQEPAGLAAPALALPKYPLDPIAAVTQRVPLEPGAGVELAALTIVAASREEVIRLANRYRQWSGLARARQVAWSLRQAELQRLQITEAEAQIFQDLAPYLIYPNHYFKQAARGLVPGESSTSVSRADLPTGPSAVVTIDDLSDLLLARQLGLAQKYLAVRGLHYPLVFLVKLTGDIGARLTKQLHELAESLNWLGEVEAKSDIHIWSLAHISQGTLDELVRRSRLVMDGPDGSLATQLASVAPLARGLRRPRLTPATASAPAALPDGSEFAGGYGAFTDSARAYSMLVSPKSVTPAPWANVLANPRFGALVTERGGGFSWMANSQEYRLTPWRNEPLSDIPGETLYIQDLDTDRVWSPQPGFHPAGAARVTHAAGRTIFEGKYDDIEFSQTVFVPVGWRGPSSVKISRLRLRNTSGSARRLRLTLYAELVLGTNRETTAEQLVTGWDDAEQMVLAMNPSHPDYPDTVAFAAMSRALADFTTDRTEFLGPVRGDELPHGLSAPELSGRIGAGLDPVAVIRSVVELPADAEIEVDCYLGTAAGHPAAVAAVNKLRSSGMADAALAATTAWWDKTLSAIQVQSPARDTDILMNHWLVYQTIAGRVWGRTGYYQSSGAFGFRDQLQDSLALMYTRPEITREIILEAARHQFTEGDAQHWWMPGTTRGLRTRMSDDRLWLPFAVAAYVRVTGDDAILEEKVPYLSAPALLEGQHDSYAEAGVSTAKATMLDHCLAAIDISLTSGAHRLPLIGTGDWNDGLNLVGAEGRGESVWLGWFEVTVLQDMAALLRRQGRSPQLAASYRRRAKSYTAAIDQSAWDGQWYRRAYYDDGDPLGSVTDSEDQIDSLSQSWAVIAGTGAPGRSTRAVDSAIARLVDRRAGIVKLLEPPFDHTAKNPGYIKGYLPGVRENGGQYTHAALWLAQATARLGRGTEAVEMLRLINPINHSLDRPAADRYRLEPYVMAGDVYSLPGQEGRGGWSWYTGSSAWMYRVWLEEIFGFKLQGDKLEIDPCIDHTWPGFKLRYTYRSSTYVIEITNPHRVSQGVAEVHLDGRIRRPGPVHLMDDGATHHLDVRLGF